MTNLVVIHSSLNGTASLSSSLAEEAKQLFKQRHPDGSITELDLAKTPIPHLDAETFAAFTTAEEDRNQDQQQRVELSDQLIEQLQQADELLLAVPMYNFGVPSTLRSYFDHIARAGKTFRYTSEGPVGLLAINKVTVIATRGGQYAGTPKDSQSNYLTTFLEFLGLTNIEFIYAEGTAMGDEMLSQSINRARQAISRSASA